jgi:hypothetical protein
MVGGLAAAGCPSGKGEGESAGAATYEQAARHVIQQLETIQYRLIRQRDALSRSQIGNFRYEHDQHPKDIAGLEAAIDQLEAASAALPGAPATAGIRQPLIVEVVTVVVLVKGLRDFAGWLKEKRMAAEAARKKEEDACRDIDSNNPSAGASVDACKAARKELNDIAADVVQETTKKIVVETVLSPVNPATSGGVILKDQAGNTLGSGIDVLTATKACESAPRGPECRLGGTQTRPSGRAPVPPGPLVVSVSGGGRPRVVLDGVEVEPGKTVEVTLAVSPADAGAGDAGTPAPDARGPGPDAARAGDATGPGERPADAASGPHFPVVAGARHEHDVSLVSYSDGNKSSTSYVLERTFSRTGTSARVADRVSQDSVEIVLEATAGYWVVRESWTEGQRIAAFTPPWRLAPLDRFTPGQEWKDSSTVTLTDPDTGTTITAQVTITTRIAATPTDVTVPAGRFIGALLLTRDQLWTYQPRSTVDDRGDPVTLSGTRRIVDRETYYPGVGIVQQQTQDDETSRAVTTTGTIESMVNTTTDQRLRAY